MAKNKISDLRNHLFEAIENLKDKDATEFDVEKANAIAKVGQTIINTVKLELEYLKLNSPKASEQPMTDFLIESGK